MRPMLLSTSAAPCVCRLPPCTHSRTIHAASAATIATSAMAVAARSRRRRRAIVLEVGLGQRAAQRAGVRVAGHGRAGDDVDVPALGLEDLAAQDGGGPTV